MSLAVAAFFYLNTPAIELNNKRRLQEELIHTVAL